MLGRPIYVSLSTKDAEYLLGLCKLAHGNPSGGKYLFLVIEKELEAQGVKPLFPGRRNLRPYAENLHIDSLPFVGAFIPHDKVGVGLWLSTNEAASLYSLMRRIGGDPRGPRGSFDKILSALQAQAVPLGPDPRQYGGTFWCYDTHEEAAYEEDPNEVL